MSTPKINRKRTASTSAQAMLAQKHQAYLVRLAVTRTIGRVVCSVIGGYLVLAQNFSPIQANIFLVALPIIFFWLLEERVLEQRINSLEKSVARLSEDDFEDDYIRSKPLYEYMLAKYLRTEPAMWLIILGVLAILRLLPK